MLRFAPSPTGDMHIGNLRAAIFNYLMARKLGQPFILRIEDTDLERNIENKDKDILDLLAKFHLKYDDLIYQSNNFPLHRDLANKLIKEGKAFYCYCSKEFLESKREEARKNKVAFRYQDSWATLEKGNKTSSNIIRLKANQSVSFTDCIKGEISFNANEIDSFVIMRNDIPTYNFACSIDDKDMTYIIRGEDHISNTPKQILIKRALGYSEDVKYAHLPIILNEENKKMSKRDKASSVKWLLSEGLEASAIANYLILLGNTKLEQQVGELFDYESCYKYFDIANISSAPAHFDYKKMYQINRSMLRASFKDSRAVFLDSFKKCLKDSLYSIDSKMDCFGSMSRNDITEHNSNAFNNKGLNDSSSNGTINQNNQSSQCETHSSSLQGEVEAIHINKLDSINPMLSAFINTESNIENLAALYIDEVGSMQELANKCSKIFMPISKKRELASDFQNEFDILLGLIKSYEKDSMDSFGSMPSNDLANHNNAYNKDIDSISNSKVDYDSFKTYLLTESKLKGKAFFKPLRIILSGEEHGIELDKLYVAIKPLMPLIVNIN